MGYDSTLYVVIEHKKMIADAKPWAEEIAKIEMCVCPLDVKWQKAEGLLLGIDGNSHITEDRYGEALKAAPIDAIISAVTEVAEKEHYRRAQVARDLLTSIKTYFKEADDEKLMVYHYGH